MHSVTRFKPSVVNKQISLLFLHCCKKIKLSKFCGGFYACTDMHEASASSKLGKHILTAEVFLYI